jgi:hypothetical protein
LELETAQPDLSLLQWEASFVFKALRNSALRSPLQSKCAADLYQLIRKLCKSKTKSFLRKSFQTFSIYRDHLKNLVLRWS